MAKIQVQPSRLEQVGGWAKRHKVLSLFGGLIVCLILYLLISSVVWQLQIHFEHERFKRVERTLSELRSDMTNVGLAADLKHSCSYRGDLTAFGRKWLGCDVEVSALQAADSKVVASTSSKIVNQLIQKRDLTPKKEYSLGYLNEVSVYSFSLQGIDCTYSVQFYSSGDLERPEEIPSIGSYAFIRISCGGNAKAQYFPLSN
jgi:hypothetical protein